MLLDRSKLEVMKPSFHHCPAKHAMGEIQGTLFQPNFNRSIRVESRSERLSGDAGTLLLRELAEVLGYRSILREVLTDDRDPDRIRHPFGELLLTELLLRAQGFTDHSDAALLRHDPLLRLAVSERRGEAPIREAGDRRVPDGLASQPTLSRFLATLAEEDNRDALGRALLELTKRRLGLREGRWHAEAIVDMDSLPIEVYGHQPGTAYNGHYRLRCYHPLVARLANGDFLGGKLREGQAHTADGGLAFVLPILEELARHYLEVWLRVDAGFPEPDLLRALEARGFRYVARLRGNRKLHRLAEPYLKRPPGRPPREGRTWVHDLSYQAGSWDTSRRVVLVVLERPGDQGELFLDHFFLLTNAPPKEMDGFQLLERYRGRGDAERDFGELNTAFQVGLPSSPRPKSHYRGRDIATPCLPFDAFGANEARWLLTLHAANLLHAARSLVHCRGQRLWSRQRFRDHVLKLPARVTLGKRRVTVCLSVDRAGPWRTLARAIQALPSARGSPSRSTLSPA
ncbi:IS1380 family transposase [soil metagenome]